MAKKYASLTTLQNLVDNIKTLFVKKTDLESTLLGYDTKGSASAVQSNLDTVSGALDTHTENTDIHFTAAERTKLSGIDTGAQKNTITGVKGGSESSYRTGNVNITATNIGLGNVDNTPDSEKSVLYATSAGSSTSATKATQDASGNVITSTYETKSAASSKLTEAKNYTDTKISDLINGAPTTLDTLGEIATAMEENADVVEALEAAIGSKANASHSHAISDVSGLQSALDGKAASSHGTHVSYSTTAPVMDGTASVGTASTVARSDHKHPIDTSRAAKSDLDSHTSNTTAHITSTERSNWNAAKTHADSAHAPSNAEKNQNAFSNVTVGSTTIAADSATDTLTLVAGTNVTITPDATNDKITISATDTNTTYSAGTGISLSGTTFSNSGVRSISTGSSNGTISVNTNGTSANVAVKGLGSAAYTASTAYDAAGAASSALTSAKEYTDSVASGKAPTSHASTGTSYGIGTSSNYGHVKLSDSTSSTSAASAGIAASPAAVKAAYDLANHSHPYLSTSGGTLTGNLTVGSATIGTNGYVTGTWFQTTANTALTTKPDTGVCVKHNNWIYHRTLDQLRSDIGAAASSHTHDDRYYTESEIDTKLSGKANSSHGNHIPSTQTANNAIFLRNDNTWQTVTPANIGAAPTSHASSATTYGVSTASNYGHAKATSTAPKAHALTAAVGSETSSFARGDHVHPMQVATHGVTTGGTGAAYTATVEGITALSVGASFIMIPNVVSTSTAPTLNVNSLGAKTIRRRVSNSTSSTAAGYNASWLAASKPIRVEYDGTYWIADIQKPVAADISGTLAIANGGTGATTAAAALTNLGLTATAAELNYCDGVTSNIQTQLNSLSSEIANLKASTENWTFTLEDGSTVTKAVYVK